MIKGSEGCKRPSDAADKIVAAIKSHVSSMFEVVESLSVAPQGFINIILSVDCLARGVTDLVIFRECYISHSNHIILNFICTGE